MLIDIWGSRCKSDFECPLDKACIQRDCQNPCFYETCGINAKCQAKNHIATCQCLQNHKGNPYKRCDKYECLSDIDCPDSLACRKLKCTDPCDCSRNAECSARNHRGYCSCKLGFTGDPYERGCTKSKNY